jgi:hypothetical protein
LELFFKSLLRVHITATKIGEEAAMFGFVYGKRERDLANPNPNKSNSDPNKKKHKFSKGDEQKKPAADNKPSSAKQTGNPTCNGCGMNNHLQADCAFKNGHPDYNDSSLSWSESESGKACKAQGMDFLSWRKRKDGTAWSKPYVANPKKEERAQKFRERKSGGESCMASSNLCGLCESDKPHMGGDKNKCTTCVNTLCGSSEPILCATCDYSVPKSVIYSNIYPVTLLTQEENVNLTALIDTGARSSNYISDKTLEWLKARGVVAKVTGSKRVCTAFNDCRETNEEVEINISFKNLIENSIQTISFEAKPLNIPYDIIIGLQTIGQYALTSTMLGIGEVS